MSAMVYWLLVPVRLSGNPSQQRRTTLSRLSSTSIPTLNQTQPASPPISCCGTPELREGLKCLEYVSDAPQAAREPRCHAAQDVFRLLIRAFAFSGRGMVEGIPLTGGDGEVERERHDQDEPGQPVRVSDLAVLEAEATGLEVREHRFDAPAPCVIERGEITRGLGHSDDPGLLVTGVLDEADVGAHLAGCQFHPRQVGCAPGQLLDRPRVSTVDTSAQVALQPQPVVPIQRLAVGDQGGRAVEPISQ